MTAFEELQRCQDQAIAFSKNRLDLALAHQKEMMALFFKVTIGYFAILYGVFWIYKILYDTHLKNGTFLNNLEFLLYLILFFFSVTFFSWASRSLMVLYSLDSRVNIDQDRLDRVLHKSKQLSRSSYSLEEEYLIKEDNDFRKITFEHNSQTLLLILGIIILVVPCVLSIYTIGKIAQNGWLWICNIFLLGLTAINVCFGYKDIMKNKQKSQELEELPKKYSSKIPHESH
ncbi:MAG: hypothetical protein ACK5T0_09300 [Vampirovibrionales bacterium]